MKTLLLTILLLPFFCNAQKKTSERYFQAMYYGQDSTGSTHYGTYFFSTENNYFPTRQEVNTLIIVNYNLKFNVRGNKLAVILKEFKNKIEWLKFNTP